MALSDDKPGVIGVIGNLGQAVKHGAIKEIKKTVENTVEQVSGKEKRPARNAMQSVAGGEMTPDNAVAQQAEALRKQQSQETTDWLYGTSSKESTPSVVEKPSEGKADLKQQLGLEQKAGNQPFTNPLEQIMGKNTTKTATVAEQLNVNPTPAKTPQEQQTIAQVKNQLHSEYYQKLTTPQKAPETQERMKEAQEEQETKEQRMERLEQEDLKKKQEEAEKKQPINTEPNIEKNRGSSG